MADNSEGAGLLRSTQVDGKGSIEATTDVENINEVNEQVLQNIANIYVTAWIKTYQGHYGTA